MNQTEYVELALRTESNDFGKIRERLQDERIIRLLHAAIGMATEAGEILDHLKKVIFYGKPLDLVNLKEECGDSFWYQAILANAADFTFTEAQKRNIEKLMARYGDKFGETGALNRNLELERRILEGGDESNSGR